ncbi:MAG: adenine phosphoribosyltransferase [Mycobacteriales bacterium]
MTRPAPAIDLPDADAPVAQKIAGLMLAVPDFPNPGVVFQDITPVLADPGAFRLLVDWLAASAGPVDAVAGVEARGFMLGAPVAYALGVPFVPVRKAGKLPREVHELDYGLEYGTATLTIHVDAPYVGRKVLVVDDVLATGGTAGAACRLVERGGGLVAGVAVLLEISALDGRRQLAGWPVHALLAV